MVCEQTNLFDYNNEEESPLYEKSVKQANRKSSLIDRQHRLMDFLKDNFISGRFYSIEEIVDRVVDNEGKPYYKLNTNPYNHDKCIALSSDIRTINWSITDRYHIIIKDSKGGCKLVESQEEFDSWKQKELKPLETKWKYLNNLAWKESRDGMCPIINLANNSIDPNDVEPIEVNAR